MRKSSVWSVGIELSKNRENAPSQTQRAPYIGQSKSWLARIHTMPSRPIAPRAQTPVGGVEVEVFSRQPTTCWLEMCGSITCWQVKETTKVSGRWRVSGHQPPF